MPSSPTPDGARALADRLAERIAGFRRADYDEGCYPSIALSAHEWLTVLAALRAEPDRGGGAEGRVEAMREACLAWHEAQIADINRDRAAGTLGVMLSNGIRESVHIQSVEAIRALPGHPAPDVTQSEKGPSDAP